MVFGTNFESTGIENTVAMIFDCICGKRSAQKRNLFAVKVKLLDNTISEYSLNKKCSGLDCLKKIAQEVNLKEVSF